MIKRSSQVRALFLRFYKIFIKMYVCDNKIRTSNGYLHPVKSNIISFIAYYSSPKSEIIFQIRNNFFIAVGLFGTMWASSPTNGLWAITH